MIDSLLGRTKLKERIAELEAEVTSLEDRLDAEERRRAAAVEDRQTAQHRANRLDDRIADLEGQLERSREGERMLEFRGTGELRGQRLAELLDRLESVRTDPEGALTAMVADSAPSDVREILGERASLVDRASPCLVFLDDAQLVSVAFTPPVAPAPFTTWQDRFRIDRDWFLPRDRVGLALIRSDLFAYGEYEDGERVAFEGIETDLRSAHSKGGFSQSRFERRRDEQISDHLRDCRTALENRNPDRLIIVGERTVLNEVTDLADATAPVDATGDPEDALADAFTSFFTTPIYLI